ncbi:MAG: HAD family phosphatase [Lachnospiraceae bacterium]|nr:HAD family phosphatase [Lachnospiraceae bacterium]
MHSKFNKSIAKKIGSLLVTGLLVGTIVFSGISYTGDEAYLSKVYAEGNAEYSFSEYKAGKNDEAETIGTTTYITIEISSEADWMQFVQNCMNDSWSRDKYVRLTADIDLVDSSSLSVPTFGGVFDGDGHSINNVNICGAGSSYGLFRYLQNGGRIEKLYVKGNVSADYSAGQVGLIVGENYGTVSDCSVYGVVTGENEVGGIVGYNAPTGMIMGCESQCAVNGKHSVGGIVGNNEGSVSECSNKGTINTAESEVTVDITEISVDNITELNSTTNAAAFTDVGGIAGISSGNIIKCTNAGYVGYEHVGYNIGGIVGRISQGYVAECVNNGRVRGRKDVGGIAGQMEPFLQMEYMVDGLGRLNEEMNVLLEMMNEATNDLDYYGNKTASVLENMSDALLDANQISADLPDGEGNTSIDEMREQLDSVGDNLITIAEDMDIIADYSAELSDIISDGNNELTADLRAIINQATLISSLSASIRADVFSYEGIEFSDTSVELPTNDNNDDVNNNDVNNDDDNDAESPIANNGRLIDCVNYGSVEADTAVGGVVGRIATEYDVNPEDDINLTGDQSLYVSATAKAVIKDCINYATVTSKKDYCGGIAGFVQYGALISDICAGNVFSESGSYIGGVAGECDSSIINCYACGNVSGKSYVGGVVGKGMDISDSISFCIVSYEGERAGAIAGYLDADGVIAGNYYVGSDIGGVDGINYTDGAIAVDYAELRELPGLPAELTEFKIVFMADGTEVGRITASYGESIEAEQIPAVPEKEGYFGVWPDYDYSFVSGSTVLEAVYEKWMGSVQSTESVTVGEVSKPCVMLVGDFLPGAELTLTVTGNEYTYSVIYTDEAEIAKALGLTEHVGTVNVRVANVDNKAENIVIETYADGNWVRANTTVIGSYIEFEATAPGKFRVINEADYSRYIIFGSILAAVIIIIVLIIIVNKGRKIKKKVLMKKTPKAVIFDLDGTIIDTEKYYRRVWPQALEHYGYHPTDEQALELRSLGRPFAPKKLKEWFGEDFDYDEVRSYRKELFEKCIQNEGVILKPGVKQLLDELRARNITIAIATATDVERTQRYLEMVGISDYFDKICSAANVKEGKPSPDVYIEACKQLKFDPAACFAVEDAPNGIKSAAAAGCRVIFVPDQTADEPEAEKLVFAKVKTADEIIGLLGEE